MIINKSKAAFRTIAEVADELGVETHVLRFWETKFSQIKPMKRSGNRRYYRPDDVELLRCIKELLHHKRYTIEGVQKLFKQKGVKSFVGEKIQDDFFATNEQEQPVGSSSIIISQVIDELKSLQDELKTVLN